MEQIKTLGQFKGKDENTPHDPKQELYHYSDDEGQREKRSTYFKIPKYQDRKSMFSSNPVKDDKILSNIRQRSSFSDYADSINSKSLKTITTRGEWNKDKVLVKKPQILIDKTKKTYLDEFREQRSRTLDMHDVQEANDDKSESSSESSEKKMK